jgi:hypothetical protein
MRYWKWVLGFSLLTALVLVAFFLGPRGNAALQIWLHSPGFQNMLSHQVSKAMKVDGEFGPLTLEGWTATTPEYRSTGWPGEAIGRLDAEGVKGKFNPWAILRRVWEVERIDVERGNFALRLPQDELKRQVIKGKKPWYAWLMPDRFYCGWIECPQAQIVFPFQGQQGRLKDVHLGATMIGRDFKYFIYNGVLEFPLLPDLKVEQLRMLITREKMEIDYASLSGLADDPARAEIQARVGMREDKSTQARVSLQSMPFTKAMPEILRTRLTGRVTGDLTWNTDKKGKNITSDGTIELEETVLRDWVWLNELARLHNNPELKEFNVEKGKLRFEVKDHHFLARDLDLRIWNKAHLQGTADYDWVDGRARVDLSFDQIPVEAWLPQQFKARFDAGMKGEVKWEGRVEDWKESKATGGVNLDGARVRYPFSSIQILKRAGVRFPEQVELKKAQIDFDYSGRIFRASRIEFEAEQAGFFHGTAEWSLDNTFSTDSRFRVDRIHSWLPPKWAQHVQGDMEGTIVWKGKDWDWKKGAGRGLLSLNQGRVRDLGFQKALVRFLKNDAFSELELDRAEMGWESSETGLVVKHLETFVPGLCGLKGALHLHSNHQLSGKLKVGLTKKDLEWLPEATTTVFRESTDGLYWATVTVSGTLQKPKQDLVKQIMQVLRRHPATLVGLAFRGLSWWLGDVFGTYDPKN